jgi:hypothetical protein
VGVAAVGRWAREATSLVQGPLESGRSTWKSATTSPEAPNRGRFASGSTTEVMISRGGRCTASESGVGRDIVPRPGAGHGPVLDLVLDRAPGSARAAFDADSARIVYDRTCVGGNNIVEALLAAKGILGRDNSVLFLDEDEEGRRKTSDE